MSIFDKYPYTNFHEMNDDWIIKTLREFGQRLDEFVAMNSLTYADPIEYNPDSVYAANTVVIYDNTAYVSKQPIPAGMLPTNDEYWLVIFPFGDLIEQGVNVGLQQIDEYLQQAQHEIDTAIETLPGLVDTWMTDHPDVITTVPTGGISYSKLNGALKHVILAEYDEDPETHYITDFVQGDISWSGNDIPADNVCRTDFILFPKGIIVMSADGNYNLSICKYKLDGTYEYIQASVLGTVENAFATDPEHKYRLKIRKSDGTDFTPADLPTNPVTYQVFRSVYPDLAADVEHIKESVFGSETVVLADASGTAASNTLNLSLGTTIPGNTVCTVTIEASAANTSNDSTLIWRGPNGNINTIGTLPRNSLTATFTGAYPESNAGSIRINQAVSGATYRIIITSTEEIDNVEKLLNDYTGICEKTPIAEVLSFRNGYWQNATTFSTGADYRVGAEAFMFDKDVAISAYNGYWICGYVNGVSIGTSSQIVVPKNAVAKLWIRKVWEDTTTPVTVDEMTNQVFILNLNKITEYERFSDTFAGIEMFRSAGFVGDSYTAVRLGHSWVDIVQGRTGVECSIFAKSGDDSGAWLNDLNNGLPALEAAAPKDLYWIALGINDGDRVDSNASYLGSISDISGVYTSYPDTFYGNYGHVLEAIIAHAPDAKIVLYKPVYRSQSRTLWGVSATQNGIKLVRDAIDEIAEFYDLPVMDALDDVLFRSAWYTEHMDYEVSAGTHPAVMLYPAIAAANMRLFTKMVLKYADHFMDLDYNT